MIGTGSVELGQQFTKEHVTAAIALVDCMDQKAGVARRRWEDVESQYNRSLVMSM
jgi:hypothetical protein